MMKFHGMVTCVLALGLSVDATAQREDVVLDGIRQNGAEMAKELVQAMASNELRELSKAGLAVAVDGVPFDAASAVINSRFVEAAQAQFGIRVALPRGTRADFLRKHWKKDGFEEALYAELKEFGGFSDEQGVFCVFLDAQVLPTPSEPLVDGKMVLLDLQCAYVDLTTNTELVRKSVSRVHVADSVWLEVLSTIRAGQRADVERVLDAIELRSDTLTSRAREQLTRCRSFLSGAEPSLADMAAIKLRDEIAATLADSLRGDVDAAKQIEGHAVATWLVQKEPIGEWILQAFKSALRQRLGVKGIKVPAEDQEQMLERYWHQESADARYEKDRKSMRFADEKAVFRMEVTTVDVAPEQVLVNVNCQLRMLETLTETWNHDLALLYVSDTFWNDCANLPLDELERALASLQRRLVTDRDLSESTARNLEYYLAQLDAARPRDIEPAPGPALPANWVLILVVVVVVGGAVALVTRRKSPVPEPATGMRQQAGDRREIEGVLERDKGARQRIVRELSAASQQLEGAARDLGDAPRAVLLDLSRLLEDSGARARQMSDGAVLQRAKGTTDRLRLAHDLLGHSLASSEIVDEVSAQVRDVVTTAGRSGAAPGDAIAMVRTLAERLDGRFRRRQDVLDGVAPHGGEDR